ncbi:tectonic-3-like [Mya arenaria]|uniref:tectonic-3-like n=1 Tax=Mya arenaria TaxID=6604 RepID=UPI0022E0925D|nr:tectonic-3-like [Mya arenaria]
MKQCRCLSASRMFLAIVLISAMIQGILGTTTTPVAATTTQAAVTTTPTTTQPPTTTPTVPPTTTLAPNEPRTVIGETVIGQCLCDLTGNVCDINCCCDDECSQADKDTFVCNPVSRPVYQDDNLCYQEDIFLFTNSPAETKTDGGLFCIYYDNYAKRNFYLDPDFILDVPSFNTYLNDYSNPGNLPKPTYQEPVYDLNSFYKAGDPVYVIYANEARGDFVIPRSLGSSECSQQSALPYLTEMSTECTRMVTSLTQNTCEQTAAFNASTYFQGFRVVKTSGLFGYVVNGTFIGISTTAAPTTQPPVATTAAAGNNTNTTTDAPTTAAPTTTAPAQSTTVDPNLVQDLFNNPYTAMIDATSRPHLCLQTDGSLANCLFTTPPSPSFSVNTCRNVVQEVRYFFTTNGTFGISQVQAQFVFRDIMAADLPLSQSFSVAYNTLSDTNDTVARSGNPGYIVGKPIPYGTLNETTNADGTKTQNIILASVEDGLTLVRPTVIGDCGTSTMSRVPLRFGEDMRTGCFVRMNVSTVTDAQCQFIQNTIVQTLEGVNARENNRFVATFGNTVDTSVGDWVRVIVSNRPGPTDAAAVLGEKCRLRMGLHIQILYANVGALALPQRRIIGVALMYDDARDVEYRCAGAACNTGVTDTQLFEVSQSVSFVDVSQPATGFQGEPPIFIARVPNDFFYPFLVYSSAGVSAHSAQTVLYPLFTCVIMVYTKLAACRS